MPKATITSLEYSKIDIYLDVIKELQKEALKKIEICLTAALKDRNFVCSRRYGRKNINDYRNYVWLSVMVDGEEYWINTFYNDVDPLSGNIHTQFGRIQFCKNLVENHPNSVKSPNRFTADGKHAIFCQENTYDPKIWLSDKGYSAEKVVEKFLRYIE